MNCARACVCVCVCVFARVCIFVLIFEKYCVYVCMRVATTQHCQRCRNPKRSDLKLNILPIKSSVGTTNVLRQVRDRKKKKKKKGKIHVDECCDLILSDNAVDVEKAVEIE